jgi:DNA (cytosine-5)-methyltransferase 1
VKRALDLFCGAGGASEGLSLAGYDVTGVDISHQPNYRYTLVVADVFELPMSYFKEFDLIWASPPCQRYSFSRTPNRKKHPDYIHIIRDTLELTRKPYIIENVPNAPLIEPIMLCGRMFDLPLIRHRLFESNYELKKPEHKPHDGNEIPVYGNGTSLWHVNTKGKKFTISEKQSAMGIHWMNRRELSQAIPPIYARYLAEQFI